MNHWSKNVALHITYNLKQPANKNTQFISTLLVESVKNAKNLYLYTNEVISKLAIKTWIFSGCCAVCPQKNVEKSTADG